jgi:glycosyltransferase involved in cell wall biosynthesis
MKILLVNSIFYPQVIGGAEGATLLLARELSAAGLQVDVLTTTGRRAGRADRLRERRLEGIDGRIYEAPSWGLYDLLPAEDSPTPSIIVRGVHHFLGIRSGRWDRLARAAIARSQPDLLHTHTIVGITPSIWRAAAGTRRPIVHTLHDYHLLCPRTTLLRSSGEICERPRWPCKAWTS